MYNSHVDLNIEYKFVIATIGKTITHPLPATIFSLQQCIQINKAFISTALPKTGVVLSAPRDLSLAPKSVMGFGSEDIPTSDISYLNMLWFSLNTKMMKNLPPDNYFKFWLIDKYEFLG
jgi:hypothetical protein